MLTNWAQDLALARNEPHGAAKAHLGLGNRRCRVVAVSMLLPIDPQHSTAILAASVPSRLDPLCEVGFRWSVVVAAQQGDRRRPGTRAPRTQDASTNPGRRSPSCSVLTPCPWPCPTTSGVVQPRPFLGT